ncbi:MAG TPA: MFS transporter [Candidatus Eisenbacteria bacterium]|nr:MFS transporter [Candidatus Eisenbacteria bacterium]
MPAPTDRSVAAPGFGNDVRVIGLIASAHFFSHFFQLTLPPLFPLLKEVWGVPYVALGLAMSVFYGASGVGQPLSGFLVDRVGAHRVLLGGMALFSASIALAGLVPAYWLLLPVAFLAGLGNSVFHPADYSILNASVDPRRIGRGYSVHAISGNLGWAVAPSVVVGLTAHFGWRVALVTVGAAGLAVVSVLATQLRAFAGGPATARARSSTGREVRLLLTAPILSAFAYFALIATALIGLQTFGVTTLMRIYDTPLALATGALTAFLVGGASGILAGGLLADRTRRHDVVAVAGLVTAAGFMMLLATGAVAPALLPVILGVTGFCHGATGPSRDMLVRSATPPGASGKVFGFVYSGLDLGSCLTPLAFGWLLDHGDPRLLLVAVGILMLCTIATVVQVRRTARVATASA